MQIKLRILLLVLVSAICSGEITHVSSQANPDDLAAVLTIMFDHVEVMRAEAENWIQLRQGAVLPFGSGDIIRTDRQGRALLEFLPGVEALLMPNTTYILDEFAPDASGQFQIRARQLRQFDVLGQTVHRVEPDSNVATYEVTTDRLTLTTSDGHFAVQTDIEQADGKTDIAIAADGVVRVSHGNESTVLQPNEGLRVGDSAEQITLPEDYDSFAQLVGVLDGCPGRIDTTNDLDLKVRLGSFLDLPPVGEVYEDQTVAIVGINQSRNWLRIRYKNGFGWVERLAVETNCADISVLPDGSFETTGRVIDVQPIETDLLEPFFGTRSYDPWFYQPSELNY